MTTPARCPAKHPGTKGQCGLVIGHRGDHTLLIESSAPWSVAAAPASEARCTDCGMSADHPFHRNPHYVNAHSFVSPASEAGGTPECSSTFGDKKCQLPSNHKREWHRLGNLEWRDVPATPSPRSSEAGEPDIHGLLREYVDAGYAAGVSEANTGPDYRDTDPDVDRAWERCASLRTQIGAYIVGLEERIATLESSLTALQQREAGLREALAKLRRLGLEMFAAQQAQYDAPVSEKLNHTNNINCTRDLFRAALAASAVEGERPASPSEVTVREALLCDEEVM